MRQYHILMSTAFAQRGAAVAAAARLAPVVAAPCRASLCTDLVFHFTRSCLQHGRAATGAGARGRRRGARHRAHQVAGRCCQHSGQRRIAPAGVNARLERAVRLWACLGRLCLATWGQVAVAALSVTCLVGLLSHVNPRPAVAARQLARPGSRKQRLPPCAVPPHHCIRRQRTSGCSGRGRCLAGATAWTQMTTRM